MVHSYHAVYVLSGADSSLIVDTGPPKDWGVVERHLDRVLADGIPPVRHLVPTHTESPHCGNLGRLMRKFPEAEVSGDVRDLHLFFPGCEARLRPRGVGDRIDLGGGRSYEFVDAVIRDVDTSLWGYDAGTGALFTGDGFAYAHHHEADQCGLLTEEMPELEIDQAERDLRRVRAVLDALHGHARAHPAARGAAGLARGEDHLPGPREPDRRSAGHDGESQGRPACGCGYHLTMLSPLRGCELTQLLTALRDRTGADVGTVVRYLDEAATECRVEAVAGPALLARGSRYPVAVSSNLETARRGEVLATPDYASMSTYDRPLDLVTLKAGFRAGCTVPLNVGARAIGSLTVSGWDSDWFGAGAVEQMLEASHEMVIALNRETLPWTSQRALICHDDMLAAEGLSRLIEVDVGLSVGATVGSIDDLAALGTDESDLIITDCFVAGQRIDEQVIALRRAGGCGRVVVIASHDTPLNRNAAVRHGAVGYCSRGAGRQAVSRALQTVAAGAAFLPPDAISSWIDPPPVTRREAEVLLLLDRGRQVKEIANLLGLSHTTVRGYVRNLLCKLDAHTTIAALHAARTTGLLQSLEHAAAADDADGAAAPA